MDPTTHSSAPVQYSAAPPTPLQYTSAGLAPVAQPPPTDGCCGPHQTLLRSRTVLCCGPCSLTVHFRGPRACSSAPPRRTGVVDPTTHSSAPVQYSAAAPAPLQYTFAGLAPVAPPPPTDGCCGPLHTLLRSRTVLCCGPCSLTVLCCTAAPGSGHLGGFHRPHCVAAAANASPCHGQFRDLCCPCCTAAPGSGHLAFSRPPAPPVALGVTNGRTTPRSYAKLTKTLISTFKTSAFKTKTLISTVKTSAFKTKMLISTPKTTIPTPESIMPTSYIYSREAFGKFDFLVFIV